MSVSAGKVAAALGGIAICLIVIGATISRSDVNDPVITDLTSAENRRADPTLVPAVQALIRLDGYECPALSALWAKGESPYGIKFEALCGPDDGSGRSYSRLHYAVYISTGKVSVCGEFGAFQDDCS